MLDVGDTTDQLIKLRDVNGSGFRYLGINRHSLKTARTKIVEEKLRLAKKALSHVNVVT